ncbi:MAG TPA: beta-N-acetylhexosaminidase [Phnomibacter sp.]|nr:beta-N-acetylhexosaminidase [Phnomibacter sp.]
MNQMIRVVKLFCLLLMASATMAQQVQIIPEPTSIVMKEGKYMLPAKPVIIISSNELKPSASFLQNYLSTYYAVKAKISLGKPVQGAIVLLLDKTASSPAEGYTLQVTNGGITATASTDAGIFYAVQSIIQLLPAGGVASLSNGIPALQIVDAPAYKYRGMHLDVSRHFFSVEYVKQFIDYLALHKINRFHWHLTDDQGWRIELKKYPGLTKAGAHRNGTIVGRYPGKGSDNQPYGGYYTQAQIKEVVAYAQARYITVVPEIEMPGHASAAIAAYPWLSCFPKEKTVIPENMIATKTKEAQAAGALKFTQETFGVFDDVFCAGKDSTFRFLEDVLKEVVPLFPSKVIHVGGDECPKGNWKRCPACQARIKQMGLKDEHELQSYFIKRMEKVLEAHGKSLMGWDEILEGGLAPNAMVMSWRGEKGGITAANEGHYVVMTPNSHFYFDHKQRQKEDSVTIGGYSPLEKVYSYNPTPAAIDVDKRHFILGAQANLWTEYIGNPAKVEYMLFPRMAALSEVLWTKPEQKNWDAFKAKLPTQEQRYTLWKIHFSKDVVNEPLK